MSFASRTINLMSPIGGLDRSLAFQAQPPFTTFDAKNVWPVDKLSGRMRLGSRSGLVRNTPAPTSSAVRMLESVNVKTDDKFDYWSDRFSMPRTYVVIPGSGTTLATGIDDEMLYGEPSENAYSFMVPSTALVDFNAAAKFRFSVDLVPETEYGCEVRLYFGMAGSGDHNNGHYARIENLGDYGWTISVHSVASGVVSSVGSAVTGNDGNSIGRFEVEVHGASVKVYWRGALVTTQTVSPAVDASKPRIGVYFTSSVSIGHRTQLDSVTVAFYRNAVFDLQRPKLVAGINGVIYRETFFRHLEASAATRRIAADRIVLGAERGGLLYMADNSEVIASGVAGTLSSTTFDDTAFTDWTATLSGWDKDNIVLVIDSDVSAKGSYPVTGIAVGNLSVSDGVSGSGLAWRLVRSPKIYNWIDDTLTEYRATSGRGMVPVGCTIIARYRDRIVLCGDPLDPNEWYMSRHGDPLDWLFSDADVDGAAIKGSNSEAGKVGEPILAFIPYGDHYALFGCKNSLWLLTGDPGSGGRIINISYTLGLVSPTAWCYGENAGEVYLLTTQGLYKTQINCPQCKPIPVSEKKIPRELRFVDGKTTNVAMCFDRDRKHVAIFLSPTDGSLADGLVNWTYTPQTDAFFPFDHADVNRTPSRVAWYDSAERGDSCLLVGCVNGELCRYSDRAEDDDGESFESYVDLGPINLGGPARGEGKLNWLVPTLADWSAPVDVAVRGGSTAEAASTAVAEFNCQFSVADRPRRERPERKWSACFIRLIGAGRAWAMESIGATFTAVGRGQ